MSRISNKAGQRTRLPKREKGNIPGKATPEDLKALDEIRNKQEKRALAKSKKTTKAKKERKKDAKRKSKTVRHRKKKAKAS